MCGETDAWDGDECKVCDYVAPPKKFQDPDVDLHKKLDLRGTDTPDMSAGDLNSAVNDQDGDGLDDETGQPIPDENEMGADDAQPMLACPACGFEAPAAEPTSINTQDPEAGSTGEGPAEGDVCPNCGQGLMEPGQALGADLGEGEAPAEEEALERGEDPEQVSEEEAIQEEDPDAEPEDDEPEYGRNGDEPESDEDEEEQEIEDEDDEKKSPFPGKPARR